jgi:Ca-activated chloride channel homolog
MAQDPLYTLKVDVSMVSVDVSVFNEKGTPVTDLSKEEFQIYEDGRPQEIQTFASSKDPYNVLLVIDRSGSMTGQFSFLIQAVNRFMTNLRAQDQFALATFDASVHQLIKWRSVQTGPRQTVKLEPGGDTNFYAALEWAARELEKIRGRKAALIFSDGEDYRIYDPAIDAKAFRKALERVRQSKSPFNFVGLGADPERGGNHIKRLAEASGGQAYFPENIEEVVTLYDEISRKLGIAYTIGYSSDRPMRDGTHRTIRIEVPGKDYRLSQSRVSYFAN